MRGGNDDVLGAVRRLTHPAPAHQLQEKPAEPVQDRLSDGRIADVKTIETKLSPKQIEW